MTVVGNVGGGGESMDEIKNMLQSIDDTLKRLEIILIRLEKKQNSESAEEFYKKHGINQTFS